MLPDLLTRADPRRTAIIDVVGSHTYADLRTRSESIASALLDGRRDLREARVAFLLPRSFEHVAVQWGIWQAGGVAVPLCDQHPLPEIEYVLEDTGADTLIAAEHNEPLLNLALQHGVRTISPETLANEHTALPDLAADRRAMILYTSGTTSRPKGVVTTHANIDAQIRSLVEAWEWTPDDHILHVLPLHHIHGIINVMSCALYAGAVCEMAEQFDADKTLDRFAVGDLTLFMAVPTIYVKLIRALESRNDLSRVRDGCQQMRLMVSGSAALPVSVLERWRDLTGHTLLERYGMTEIGMALSNPLRGERRPGFVGTPLPGVDLRLVSDDGAISQDGQPGEIHVRGPSVFGEYWNRPNATSEAFTDGWFRTGDVAEWHDGMIRILGRDSIDIIKSGGYKISALEVESVLLQHDAISECAVVGVPDDEWGERVAAAIVAAPPPTLTTLRSWARGHLATYKLPTRLLVLDDLPRNTMGKVTKKALVARFSQAAANPDQS